MNIKEATPRPFLVTIASSVIVVLAFSCAVNKLVTVKEVTLSPHPAGIRYITNIYQVPAEAVIVPITNISVTHTTVTLINRDYYVGLPVWYTNKVGKMFTYNTRVWFWEATTDFKTWAFDGWSTNQSVTMPMTSMAKMYRGWNQPHGVSLRVKNGQPQPPDL